MSVRQAIKAMCKQCIYDPQGGTGTWRQQVSACTSTTCPLYPYRPREAVKPADRRCPVCGGNDLDRPCAYPSEKQKGCLRDRRLRAPKPPRNKRSP